MWARACLEAFAPPVRPFVVWTGPSSAPTGIAALGLGRGRLELLGAAQLHEPADLLYANRQGLTALAAALAELGYLLRLKRLPAASQTAMALRVSARRGTYAHRTRAESYPTLLSMIAGQSPAAD
jgi:hypothetical protein